MPLFNMRMSDTEHAALRVLSEERGESMTETVRAGLGCLVMAPARARRSAAGEGGVTSSRDERRPDDRVVGAPSRPEPGVLAAEDAMAALKCEHKWKVLSWGTICEYCKRPR